MENSLFASVQHVFKANDIRGLLHEITPELARAVGYAVAQKTSAKQVIVGRDMRETSPELLEAVVEGVNKAGAKAIVIGMCTTSLFNWAISNTEEADAGIMITASHNPSEYNGIKMAKHDGLPISGTEIYTLLSELPTSDDIAQREDRDIVELYIRDCMRMSGMQEGDCKGMKIAVDFGNGMGSLTIKPLLTYLGVETAYLYDIPDARFPNHEANPAKQETLHDLQELIKTSGAQLGVALDGDADRIGFLDEEGRILRGDQTLGLLSTIVAKEKTLDRVVVAPNFGWNALDAITQTGATLVWERIGRTFAIKKMRDTKTETGGELSGHYFFRSTHELESVDYVLMLMLKALKEEKSFARMTDYLHTFVNSTEINFHVDKKEEIIARMKETFIPLATRVDELDGIRCEFNRDWWFIVRASNTEPLLRLTVEAKDQNMLDEKIKEMTELIEG